MALDLANDIQMMDGLATVDLVARDGDATFGQSVSALRRGISTREAQASNGRYLTSDVRFHWQVNPDNPDATRPKIGDVIVDIDGRWTIVDVSLVTLRTRWACVCRNVEIQAGLTQQITIQSAAWTKDANGAQVPTWSNLFINRAAKIQRVDANETTDNHRQRTRPTFVVYTASDVVVSKDNRIKGPDGTLYRITGYTTPDRVDQLLTINCEEWTQ